MDIGIFASVNGPGFKSFSINHLNTVFYYISDLLLGLEPWLNETTACTYPEPWANKTETESKDREVPIAIDKTSDFVGSYFSPLLPVVNVSANSSDLLFNMNRLHGILHPSSEKDRFLWEVTDPWEFATSYTDNNNETVFTNVTFLRDGASGAVDGLRMELEVNMTFTKGSLRFGKTSGANRVVFSSVLVLLLGITQLVKYLEH